MSRFRFLSVGLMALLLLLAGCPGPGSNGGDNNGDNNGGDTTNNGGDNTGNGDNTDGSVAEEAFGDPRPVAAKIILPAGVTLDPATLVVSTITGDTPVAADGSVSPQILTTAPGLVQVVGAGNKIVLLGFIGAEGGSQELSAKSTATALLYLSVFGFGTPTGRVADLLTEIDNSAAAATLADAIAQAMATNPTVITDGDATLDAAIETANANLIREALFAPAKPSTSGKALLDALAAKSSGISRPGKSATRLKEDSDFLVLIEPGSDVKQSGVQMLQNDEGVGVIALNNFRRRATMYAYLVGVQEEGSENTIDVNPPQPMGSPIEIPGSVRLSAFNAAASFTGQVPWAPVKSDPIVLPRDEGAAKTIYRLIVIGPSLGNVSGSAFSDSRFSSFRAGWNQKISDLQYEMVVYDFVIPVVEFLAVGGASSLPVSTRVAGLTAFKALIDPELALAGLAVNLTSPENVRLFLKGFLEAAASSDAELSAFGKSMIQETLAENPALVSKSVTLQGMERGLARAISARSILLVVDLAFGTLDLVAVGNDLSRSARDEGWNATVVQRRVKLEPADATLDSAFSSVLLTATVNGLPDSTFLYRWSTTGTHGKLFDTSNHEGTAFDSTDKTIQYIPDPTLVAPGPIDTVTVEVFPKDGDAIAAGAVSLGTATATINGPVCRNPDDLVNIPYPPLRSMIASALGKPADQIKCADMQGLTTLSPASVVNFGSGFPNPLEGLQYASNLTFLNVNFCLLSNAQDWDRIKDLTKLVYLDIGRTSIGRNMEALRRLTELDTLLMDSTRPTDLSPLAGMSKLRIIHFQGADTLSSLHGLENKPNLEILDAVAAKVVDIGALSGSPNMLDLDLRHCRVSSLAPIKNMSKLKRLVVGCNSSVVNIAEVADKPDLDELDLVIASGRVRDLTPLTTSQRLRLLFLNGQQILTLDPLKDLNSLTQVELDGAGNLFTNVDGLLGTNLVDVDLSNNTHLTNIDGFGTLNGFVNVGLNNTGITTVLPIVQSHMSQGALNIACTPAESSDRDNVQKLKDRGITVPGSTCSP